MRWTRPYYGEQRVRSGFLWLPRTANGETRWLEFATWREEWLMFSGWSTCDWVDKEAPR